MAKASKNKIEKIDYTQVTDKKAALEAAIVQLEAGGEPYEGKIIKGFGNILAFLQTRMGFFLCVLLPMIIFFMYELVRVVMNTANYKKAKAEEDLYEVLH